MKTCLHIFFYMNAMFYEHISLRIDELSCNVYMTTTIIKIGYSKSIAFLIQSYICMIRLKL